MKLYLFSLFLLVAFFSFSEVNALKPQKIDICHLDQETNTYKLLNVSQTAWDNAHKKHGDGLPGEGNLDEQCKVIPPIKVFARVYREKGTTPETIDVYNATTDDLYVEVVDYNGGFPDGVLNAGDKVHVIALPADFNGDTTPIGVSEHIITSILLYDPPNVLGVHTANGDFAFGGVPPELYVEAIDINAPPPEPPDPPPEEPPPPAPNPDFAILIDNIGGGSLPEFTDHIQISKTSPSQPASDILQGNGTSSEDPWLEVRVYP